MSGKTRSISLGILFVWKLETQVNMMMFAGYRPQAKYHPVGKILNKRISSQLLPTPNLIASRWSSKQPGSRALVRSFNGEKNWVLRQQAADHQPMDGWI